MDKWLRENWFKLGILIVLGILGVALTKYSPIPRLNETSKRPRLKNFFDMNSKKEDLELQSMCSKKSDEMIERGSAVLFYWDKTAPIIINHNSHYNRTLNKCFLQTVGLSNDSNGLKSTTFVMDEYENKIYGVYEETTTKENNKLQTSTTMCNLALIGKECVDHKEFDKFIKSYMED